MWLILKFLRLIDEVMQRGRNKQVHKKRTGGEWSIENLSNFPTTTGATGRATVTRSDGEVVNVIVLFQASPLNSAGDTFAARSLKIFLQRARDLFHAAIFRAYDDDLLFCFRSCKSIKSHVRCDLYYNNKL